MEYQSKSDEETQKIAADLAASLVHNGHGLPAQAGEPIIIALEGELGAGKTTFTKGFTKALGVEEEIKSPTFVIMKTYQLSNREPYHFLFHLDCYRLRDEEDLIPLGVKDIMAEKGNIILIEWSERVANILPEKRVSIHIDHISENERKISIQNRLN